MNTTHAARVLGGLFWALLSLWLHGCGEGGGEPEPILPGSLVYVDSMSGRDHVFIANSNLGSSPIEVPVSEILVMPSHDAGDQNLTSSLILEFGRPIWSPDARKIALIAYRQSGSQVLVADPANGRLITASRQLGEVRFIDWAADGRSLAYVEDQPGSDSAEIVTVIVESGKVQSLIPIGGRVVDALRWSEDSSELFYSYKETIFDQRRLNKVDVATGMEQVVSELPNGEIQDLWRDLSTLYSVGDNEFQAISVSNFDGDEQGLIAASAPGDGRYIGWFSTASADVLLVEQVVNRGELIVARQRPFVAKPDLSTPSRQREYFQFPVNAPVALKWDFIEK